MKIPVYGLKGTQRGSIAVAKPVRPDLIMRAVQAEQASTRQPYGSDPKAGKKTSAHYHGRRGVRHAMMNREMARMKRITSPGFLYMRARYVPQAVKGRKAHPPKGEKNWFRKINKKERLAALFSAASATSNKEWIERRGHTIQHVKHIPLVVEDRLEEISILKDFKQVMENLGLLEEMNKLGKKKIRSGRGTMRGRKFKKKRGMLFIITEDKGIVKAVRNLLGLEVCEVGNLDVEMLAPGASPGRLCIWTEGAVKNMEELA
jgi:large subunit ribosomal protein L4e